MIEPGAFLSLLKNAGIHTFTGVPCSYLKALITELGSDNSYVAAASEGEAVGIATGACLAGSSPAVLIQSSGLGNCVNPLTSLVAPFEIPMLLVVGYRNAEGSGPPQHTMMGEITEPLLDLIGIRHVTLERSLDDAQGQITALLQHSHRTRRAVAILIRDKTFSAAQPRDPSRASQRMPCEEIEAPSSDRALRPRTDALRGILAGLSSEDLVIATTGMTSRELFTLGDRPGNFYMVGSMGCAAGLGLGIARENPGRRVVVIDGDGALLMKLGSLATIGHYQPANLVHIVLDNGTYESTGSQPTTATTTHFNDLARAAGYRRSIRAKSPSDLTHVIESPELGRGPTFVHLPIADGHLEGVGRVPSDLPELARRFMRNLETSHVHTAVG